MKKLLFMTLFGLSVSGLAQDQTPKQDKTY